MPYSVLLIGATGTPGKNIANSLAKYKHQLNRVAYLTNPTAQITPEREAKYTSVPLERVIGDPEDPETYRGFDILICAVHQTVVLDQIKYFNAAFAGGVKHVYPSEFGVDFSGPAGTQEPYFATKRQLRESLEEKVSKDASLGYTYVVTGIFSELLVQGNILGLSEDKKTATFLGDPDALLTSTHTDDIGDFVALSTLPSHLKFLNERRALPISSSTMKVSEYFTTVSRVLASDKGHPDPITVHYLTRESSYAYEQQQRALGNGEAANFTAVKRVVGFGECVAKEPVNDLYPEVEIHTWEDTVKRFLV